MARRKRSSMVDSLDNGVLAAALSEKSEQMLNAVAVVYGGCSSEDERAEGPHRNERRGFSQSNGWTESVA